MTATFGDFLDPAARHIGAAIAFRGDLPDSVREDAIAELGRLVATMARYLGDLPFPDSPDPARPLWPSPQTHALADAQVALRRAARSLRHGAASTPDAHPVLRHLAAAADHLAAGRDLLQTHITADPSGARSRSFWAPTITSPPAT